MKVEELVGKSDAELGALLGHDEALKQFKSVLKEAQGLSGQGRKDFEASLNRMLTPKVYTNELQYQISRAKKKSQTGKDAMACCDPEDLL